MPITAADFDVTPDARPAERSAMYDPERPFLFEGLAPRYATRIVRSVFVPMRDGVRLSTDFHVPLGAKLPLPVVLVRTPYGKRTSRVATPALLPEQGFVYAVQDVRGRHESEGEFVACTSQDREDGYDTIDWIARQPWCNGAIGTLGSSYTGETAAKAAAMRHPNHRCSVIMFDGAYAGGNERNGAYLQGGVTMLRMMFEWFRGYVPKISYGPPPHVDRERWFASPWADAYATQPVALPPLDADALLRTLPVHDMLDRAGAPPSEFGEMMRRSADPADPYWDAQGFIGREDRFHAPALYFSGPLERGGSSFATFRQMRTAATTALARNHQHLMFTPAHHSRYDACAERTVSGARALGDTRFPYYRLLIDWFGRWLRDDAIDAAAWPAVRYFLIGRNAWCTASDWPPPETEVRRLYLASGGRANTRHGDGRLEWGSPAVEHPPDRYTYDPSDPVPSEPPGTSLDLLGGGYADRGAIEDRADVLVYTSAPLERPLAIVGPVFVELHVSSNVPDTDFSAVLTEVDADGRSINVTHGIARARYREGLGRQVPIAPGAVHRLAVDLWHAAIEIPAGHRVRLEITSSHFPFYDRNLNTGGDNYTGTEWRVAENAVHHGPRHPSALVVHVLPTG